MGRTENYGMTDRRSFLKGAGITAAAGAFMLAGCSPPQTDGNGGEPASGTQPVDSIAWDEEYDVVVVGAGIAGCATAMTVASEGNGATCLLVEKDVQPNGNSPFCQGSVMGSEDRSITLEYLRKLTGDDTPDDVLTAFADELAENYNFLINLGANPEDLYVINNIPAVSSEYPEFNMDNAYTNVLFTGAAGGPTHVLTFLLDQVKSSEAVAYQTSTPFEALVQDSATGEVLGIVAKGKNIRAKGGVVMCCGGFESNQDMIATYTGVRGAHGLAGIGNTGDGITACLNAGAGQWHMSSGAMFLMACRDLEDTKYLSQVWHFNNKGHGITVGINGRRFYNDWDGCSIPSPMDQMPYAEPGANLSETVTYRHGLTQYGGDMTHLCVPERAWYIYDANGLAAGAIPSDLSADPVADGWAYTADTLEDLAAKIDVPAEELARTVAGWNASVEAGFDAAFYRWESSMEPVATPPFYATLCVPTMLNTDGGPIRSAKAEVCTEEGEPIPGLFSAGEFGSVWGHLYQGGGNLGECCAFGRIAARSAMSRLS